MTKYAGLWIDHKEAIIVNLQDNNETVSIIQSGIGAHEHLHFQGGSRQPNSSSPGASVSEKKYENSYNNALHKYYGEVIVAIKDNDQILILGPGEAKTQLESEIKKFAELAVKVKKIETADKMTEPQLKAKVNEFFKQTLVTV